LFVFELGARTGQAKTQGHIRQRWSLFSQL